MIQDKQDLANYLSCDMRIYYAQSKWERCIYRLTGDPIYYIAKYVRLLRKEEYYANTGKNKLHTMLCLFYLRKKNSLGNKLGFKIPRNCFGPGLTIYHHGEIIVNENARIGADCKLHGGNCIGNNALTHEVPQIGDGLDMGIGAKIVGPVALGSHITVGANAVVNRSCEKNGVVLAGVPAREIKKECDKR